MEQKQRKHWTFSLSEAELETLIDEIKKMPAVVVYESAYVKMQRRQKSSFE
jgi:hypothetical protein